MNSAIIMVNVFSNGVLVGRLVIGIYYGFLSTFPLGPSHIVSVRSLLLEDENEQTRREGREAVKGVFIAGVSGFMLAQCAMFLSIYYPPLYMVWFKPHLINLLLLPGIIYHCCRTLSFELIPLSHFGHPLLHPKMQITFWESFIFQILNPFVLPSPVFTRLMSIYMFRYSDIPILIAGNLLGWFIGQIVFMSLSYYLLVRFQRDTPTIYSITKRVIHWGFVPLMLVIIATTTGAAPLTHTASYYRKGKFNYLLSVYKWPQCLYIRHLPVRPRYYVLSGFKSSVKNQANAPFNKRLHKLQKYHYSEYFFDVCVSHGEKRLAYTYPLNLSIVQEDIADGTGIDLPDEDILYKDWIDDKRSRLEKFREVIKTKMFDLDQGASIENIIEKKLSSRRLWRKPISKKYYPNDNIKDDMSKPTPISNTIRDSFPIFIYPPKIMRKSCDPRLAGSSRAKPIAKHNQSHWSQVENDKSRSKYRRSFATRYKLIKRRLTRLKAFLLDLDVEYTAQEGRKRIPHWQSKYSSNIVTLQLELARSTLTRRKRRLVFYRSSGRRVFYWRRRNATALRRFRQKRPRSWFFIRAKFVRKFAPKKDDPKKKEVIGNPNAAITVDLSYIHAIRGPILIFQGLFRKFIKLPLAITIKSIVRLLLLQPSEWFEDWKDWGREKHVYCLFSGETVAESEIYSHIYDVGWLGLHTTWIDTGMQVRIVFPFDIVPWRVPNLDVKQSDDAKDKSNHAYLNIWGKQTYTLFGETKQYEILGPVKEVIILILKKQASKVLRVLYKYFVFVRKIYRIIFSFFRKIFRKVFRVIRKIFKFFVKIFKKVLSICMFIWKKINQIFLSLKQYFVTFTSKKTADTENIQKVNLTADAESIEKDELYKEPSDSKVQGSKYKIQDPIRPIDYKIFDLSKFQIRLLPTKFALKNKNVSFSSPKVLYKILLKYIKYQKIQIRFLRLQLYIKTRLLRRICFRLLVLSVRNLKRGIKVFIRNMIKLIRYLPHVPTIVKCKINLFYYDHFKQILFGTKNSIGKPIVNIFAEKPKTASDYDLSNAYILYRLWDLNRMTDISVTNLMMDWSPNHPLRDGLQSKLEKQGILNTKKIEFMDVNCFEQWLKPFRRYTPYPEIWEKIAPTEWRDSMRAYWAKSNQFNMYVKERIIDLDEFRKERLKDKTFDITLIDKYFFSRRALNFHQPLFKKAAKLNKRWRLNLLYSRYLHSSKDFTLNQFEGWDTDLRKENQKYRMRKLQESKSETQEPDSENRKIIWGPSHTRYDVPGPYLPPINLNETCLPTSPEKMPIHSRYEKMKSLNRRIRRPRQRLSFKFIRQYKWLNLREKKRHVMLEYGA